ncbi:MAG TPA: ABC transporter ATP-binding protein [Candidatus Aphodousia faecipullorum]|nr:ABC transporter ATP-binding protein [Candidatus Aphodousia faecipullorum]
MTDHFSSTVALSMRGVTRRERGAGSALIHDISFDVKAGSLVALVGADGAGKTTLMRTAAGLLKPQEGDVCLFGENLYQNLNRLQAECGYMPQQFGLYADLSVRENLLLYADLFGLTDKAREARFTELLSMTGLAPFTERLAGKLSGGMKQKLGLACALLNRPKLLLLDEPSVGVDPLSRKELWRILIDSARTELMTVVVATTYMDEASLCDQVLVLEDGKLVLSDTPQAIAEHARGLVFAVNPADGEKVRDLQAGLLDDTECVLDAVPEAGSVRVLVREKGQSVALQERLRRELTALNPRLEDGYLVLRARNEAPWAYSVIHSQFSPSSSSAPLVRAHDLVRRFGDFVAVDRTSFDVFPGEIFGLLGPNGAGKTTTFKMLCGLLTVTSGELEVAGIDIKKDREAAREQLGYMSQKFALYGDLSVRQNMTFFAQAYGLFDQKMQDRIAALSREFHLNDVLDRPAKTLSGGIKQRLAMAVALLHNPKILFLDEPTSGADVPTRRQFWRWMTALSAAGTTIIVTTHFMEEAQYCDRLLIQDGGKPLIVGTPEAVRGDSRSMDEAFIRVVKAFRDHERSAS